MSTSDGQYRIEALAKGLAVLRLFDENIVELRLREICDRTGMPMPTAFRVVATLEADGFLDRTPDGAVRPGLAALALGSAALRGSSLVQASDLPLRRLADDTGETVNLGVLMGDQVLYVARIRNADLVTANIQVGSTLPAIYTSMGKMLLAGLTPEELAVRVTESSFDAPAGPNAKRTLADLHADLDRIRADGYALQDEELARGLRSVAVPVRGADGGTIAAINVAVSSARHDVADLRGPLLERVRVAATDISTRLGAR
jgi:IclR family transcriptional regulator, pca regulon regulatory protein